MLLFFSDMEKRPGPAELLTSLLKNNRYSLQELDHLYRLLSKRSHPDATGGGSGEEFIALRRVYESARHRLDSYMFAEGVRSGDLRGEFPSAGEKTADTSAERFVGASSGRAPLTFDPYGPIRDAGYNENLPARACLIVTLRSFFHMGLHNYKIRSMKGLQRRNAELLRAAVFWALRYDKEFASLFAEYSRTSLQSLSTTWEIKNFNYAKRLFLDGVTGFFDFQKSGRPGTAEVAAEKLTWCSYTLRKVIRREHPMAPLAEWFIAELELPPALRPEDTRR
jgi:hypothetical protein